MACRAMYAYAWDLAEAGVPAVVDELRALGINTITLAASYHAGKFIRPRGRSGKVYFPEDGTVYFRPDPNRYGVIKPVPNHMLEDRDVLEEVCNNPRMSAHAWLVLMHNTRLGEAYPDATAVNAFGDRYIYNLCPSAPAARRYAVALCTDVADRYAIDGISLETPGFLPYAHGFHHEFALVRQNAWLDRLLGLCFCEHCLAGAAAADIDGARLRHEVSETIERYLSSGLDFPDDMADAFWLADVVLDPELSRFLHWRCEVVSSLVAEIRAAVRRDASVAVIPSVARPTSGAWYEGSDLAALATAAGIVEVCFYEPGAARIRSDLWDVQRRLARGDGRLRGILRPGHPDLASREAVLDAVAALAAGGIEDLAFYNYGHLRQTSLDWMGEALAALEH